MDNNTFEEVYFGDEISGADIDFRKIKSQMTKRLRE